jgi:4'-phosphopantetheinyl transferase
VIPERLRGDTVHVWRADLSRLSDRSEMLCSQEHERANRLLDRQAAILWKRGRGLLRELLGSYLGLAPETLRFVVGPYGKPKLELDEHQLDLPIPAFNLSHSGTLAVYAFTCGGEVGVDVQLPRPQLDELAIAARVFGADCAAQLTELEPAARARAFLRAWVRHEASLKWQGIGIGTAATRERHPWILELDPGHQGAAALALDRAPVTVLYRAVGS